MSQDQDKKTFDKADLKIPVWPARKAKGKGQRQEQTVTSVMLILLNPDQPGYVLLNDAMPVSETKCIREGEWRLTAVDNHTKLKNVQKCYCLKKATEVLQLCWGSARDCSQVCSQSRA